MADLPTPEEMAAWREACAQATPGPWHADGSSFSTHECDGEEFTIGDVFSRVPDGEVEPDAIFIAAARDALPRLLDAVEALRADLAERDRRIAAMLTAAREAAAPHQRYAQPGECGGGEEAATAVVEAVESAAAPYKTMRAAMRAAREARRR